MTELEVFTQSLNVSRATLIVSILVSLASIVFASLEMAFQRSHNVKSVRPYCEVLAKSAEGAVSICIRNVGLGPLIFKRAFWEGDEAAVAGLGPLRDIPTGFVLPPMALVEIFSGAESEALTADIGRCALAVEYHDLYDKRYMKSQLFPGAWSPPVTFARDPTTPR